MSRSAPPITRLARYVAGEAAPKERVRVISRAIQDSASLCGCSPFPPRQGNEGDRTASRQEDFFWFPMRRGRFPHRE
jgi:hypothetical protein